METEPKRCYRCDRPLEEPVDNAGAYNDRFGICPGCREQLAWEADHALFRAKLPPR